MATRSNTFDNKIVPFSETNSRDIPSLLESFFTEKQTIKISL